MFSDLIYEYNNSCLQYDEYEDAAKYDLYKNEVKKYLDNPDRQFNTGSIRSHKYFLRVVCGYQDDHIESITNKLLESHSDFISNHLEKLKEIAYLNDSFGGPLLLNTFLGKIEVNNLKYLLQSLYILEHLKSINKGNVNFYEIGGGYGGLSFWIHKLSVYFDININSYVVFDLEEVSSLQNYYFDYFNIESKSHHKILLDNKEDDYNYLISNYAFSEIPINNKQIYIEKLFPIIKNGFITWNVHKFDKTHLKNLCLDSLKIVKENIHPYGGFGDLIVYF